MFMPPSVEAAGLTIDQQRQVEFLFDVRAVLDVEAVDLLALGAGLMGDQHPAEHLLGMLADFLDRLGEAHTALAVGAEALETALAAAAGVDLALDHIERAGQPLGGAGGFVGGHGREAL
jgi:hypothetical protein